MAASWALRVVVAARLLGSPTAIPAHGPVDIPWPNDSPDARTDRRGNFCNVNFQPSNETRRLMHALSGRQISVALNLRPHGQQIVDFVSYDAHTGVMRGLLVDVMDEMARRGNFTWRNSFAVVNVTDEQMPFNVMSWAVHNYDVFVDWRTINKQMEAGGMSPLMPFLDTSYHLLLKPDIIAPTVFEQVFSYLRPFALDTWLVFAFCWVLTAWAYCKFEAGQDDFQGSASDLPCLHSVYLCALLITGAGGPQPTTCAGKFMSLMFSILVVLVVAAYTANLASLLVVNARVSIPIQTLAQAAAQRVEVCTAYRTESEDYFEQYTGSWRDMDRALDSYLAVASGECKVAMVRSHLWHVARHNRMTNPDCSLYMIPEASKLARSGFIVRVDQPGSFTCIENAAQVFNLILLDMDLDGYFDQVRRQHTNAANPIKCPPGFPTAPDGDSDSLTLGSAGGMFVTYFACMLVAYFIYRSERRCCHVKQGSSHTDESDSTSELKLM